MNADYVSEKAFKLKIELWDKGIGEELCENVPLNQCFSNSSRHQDHLQDWFTTQILGSSSEFLIQQVWVGA